ncbi:hypothetical protein GCM10023174_23280 [Chelativorans composti]
MVGSTSPEGSRTTLRPSWLSILRQWSAFIPWAVRRTRPLTLFKVPDGTAEGWVDMGITYSFTTPTGAVSMSKAAAIRARV